MPRPTDARLKMLQSQALLQRERGLAATALPDVIKHSGAPRGSIYHHFPGGRGQLAEEATEYASQWISGGLAEALAVGGVGAALDAFVALWSWTLESTGFAAGCAVAAGAMDAAAESGARRAARDGFAEWEGQLRAALEAGGATPARAETLAVTFLSATEGAIILARAECSLRPLQRVAEQLHALLDSTERERPS